jgi:hypothetical protein
MSRPLNISGEETKGIEMHPVSHAEINIESVSSQHFHMEAEPLLLKVSNHESIINPQSTDLM